MTAIAEEIEGHRLRLGVDAYDAPRASVWLRRGESLSVGEIRFTAVNVGGTRARLGIDAPKELEINSAATDPAAPAVRSCRGCGCTEQDGCPGGCFWVLPRYCSVCAVRDLEAAGLRQESLAVQIGLWVLMSEAAEGPHEAAVKLVEVAANAAGRAGMNEVDVGGWLLASTTAVPDVPARLAAARGPGGG